MPNADLIRRTVAMMEEHEDAWDQSEWVGVSWDEPAWPVLPGATCGTTLCFAGFAMLAHLGPEKFFRRAIEKRSDGYPVSTLWAGLDMGREARVAMGLDEAQARTLFGSGVDDLAEYKELITLETGVTFP